jgi:hypothetical protein
MKALNSFLSFMLQDAFLLYLNALELRDSTPDSLKCLQILSHSMCHMRIYEDLHLSTLYKQYI